MVEPTAKQVIIVIGYPGCGKTSVCAILADQGFHIHRPSDTLRVFAAEQNIQLTGRQDYVDLHHTLNSTRPYAIVEPVIASTEPKICIDGLRSPFLLDKLQSELEHVVLIALECPIDERFRRVQADDARRGTHRAPADLQSFEADELSDYRNPDRNLPNMVEMMERADFTIDASQPPQKITAQLSVILQKT